MNMPKSAELFRKTPIVCDYFVTHKYACVVPKKCNGTDVIYSCNEVVNGTWKKTDGKCERHNKHGRMTRASGVRRPV